MADQVHKFEWDVDNQSADELATALFERMIADGMPASMAAEASESIKRQMVDVVEREQLRMFCQFLRWRFLTSGAWWQALITELETTRGLLHDTLLGSTK